MMVKTLDKCGRKDLPFRRVLNADHTTRRVCEALWLGAALVLSGCGDSRPRSLVDDLRFIAASVEPPEVMPGETVTITWEFLDAGQRTPRDLEFLFLPCTQLGGTGECLELLELGMDPAYVDEEGNITEQGYRKYFTRFVQRGTTRPSMLELAFQTSQALGSLLAPSGDGSQPPTGPPSASPESGASSTLEELQGGLSMLLCADGACDALLLEVDAYLEGEPIERSGEELLADLTTGGSLVGLPRADVARATKGYLLSRREEAQRNHNPFLAGLEVDGVTHEGGDTLQAPSGAQLHLTAIPAEGAAEIYTATDDAGVGSEVEETLEIHWFCTGGQVEQSNGIGGPIGGGGPDDASDSLETVFLAPVVETATELVLYAVLTDERLGEGWLELHVVVAP